MGSSLVLVDGFGVTVFLDFISPEQNVWDKIHRGRPIRPQALTVAAEPSTAMDQRNSQEHPPGRDRLLFSSSYSDASGREPILLMQETYEDGF